MQDEGSTILLTNIINELTLISETFIEIALGFFMGHIFRKAHVPLQ